MTQNSSRSWTVYIVECKDKTLYTGIARDLEQRLSAHNAGKGAKYTAGRRPVTLIYREGARRSQRGAGSRECDQAFKRKAETSFDLRHDTNITDYDGLGLAALIKSGEVSRGRASRCGDYAALHNKSIQQLTQLIHSFI